MADKFIDVPNDDTQSTLSVDEDKWLKRLNSQINESTNQNSINFQPTSSSMSPPSLMPTTGSRGSVAYLWRARSTVEINKHPITLL